MKSAENNDCGQFAEQRLQCSVHTSVHSLAWHALVALSGVKALQLRSIRCSDEPGYSSCNAQLHVCFFVKLDGSVFSVTYGIEETREQTAGHYVHLSFS